MKLTESHYTILRKLNHRELAVKGLTLNNVTGHADIHITKWLTDLQRFGLAVNIGEMWHITNAGRAEHKNRNEKLKNVSKERNKVSIYEMENYQGFDKKMAFRPGCFDFLNCPSLIFEERVYRKNRLV